jgi:site-specific recombinase XerD
MKLPSKLYPDPYDGKKHHPKNEVTVKSHHQAANIAGINNNINPRTFQHSFATHLLIADNEIRSVQELFGGWDVKTTMIYIHVLNFSTNVQPMA